MLSCAIALSVRNYPANGERSVPSDGEREVVIQPIERFEKQRAYDKALELARKQVNGIIQVQQVCIGVDAAFDYCNALDEARQEMAQGEIDVLKVRIQELEQLRAQLVRVREWASNYVFDKTAPGHALGYTTAQQEVLALLQTGSVRS